MDLSLIPDGGTLREKPTEGPVVRERSWRNEDGQLLLYRTTTTTELVGPVTDCPAKLIQTTHWRGTPDKKPTQKGYQAPWDEVQVFSCVKHEGHSGYHHGDGNKSWTELVDHVEYRI